MERAIYEQDRQIDDAMERFHAKLTNLSESPISLDAQRESELIENVKHAKKLYKECRTNYSDSVIDSHSASSSARSKEALAKQKYDSQAEVFAQEIVAFLEHFRHQLPERLAEFFEAQDKMLTAVANAHAASMSMLGSFKLEKDSQKKRREDYMEQQSPVLQSSFASSLDKNSSYHKAGEEEEEGRKRTDQQQPSNSDWDLIYGIEQVDLRPPAAD